jgi:hypothetical protein
MPQSVRGNFISVNSAFRSCPSWLNFLFFTCFPVILLRSGMRPEALGERREVRNFRAYRLVPKAYRLF